MNAWASAFAAPSAGILLTLSLAPISIWPAAIVGLLLLLWALQHCSVKAALWRGWLFGLGLFGSGASWVYVSIHLYGNAPVPLAAFLTVLWCMGLALLSAFTCALLRWINPQSSALDIALFPALWVLGEWLRTWLLTGFPWLFIGYAHVDGPLQGWAPIGGVLSISFILAFTAAWLFQLLTERRLAKLAPVGAIVISLWSIGLSLDANRWTTDTGETLDVGLVQANIDQSEKWQPDKLGQHIALQLRLSESLWHADVVLWPEAAIPMMYHQAEPLLRDLEARAQQQQTHFISGIPYRDPSNNAVHNSIVNLSEQRQLYFKRQLVPFGEFMPLESLLRGLIDFFDLPMSSFSAGPSDQGYLKIGDYKAAALICYEAVYLNLVKATDRLPPDILLTISNDTWFGSSFGPLQHLQMARMRALEWGRSMLRGTNNGVSALIGPDGRLLQQTEQFRQQVLRGSVPIRQGETPYAQFGTWPILLLCLALSVLTVLRRPKASDKAQ